MTTTPENPEKHWQISAEFQQCKRGDWTCEGSCPLGIMWQRMARKVIKEPEGFRLAAGKLVEDDSVTMGD